MSSLNKVSGSIKEFPQNYKILIAAGLFHILAMDAEGQLSISPSAALHIEKNATIYTPGVQVDSGAIHGKGDIVNYNDWITNVSVMTDADSVSVAMEGSSMQTIQGNTNFHRLIINNPAGVELGSDQRIRDRIQFLNGLVQLEGWDIDLGSTGILDGESETSRITDTSNGGTVKAIRDLNAPTNADDANLRLAITTSENLGETEIIRGHDRKYSQLGMGIYLRYVIRPTNQPTDSIDVTAQYFDAEWDLANGPKAQLDIRRQDQRWKRAFGTSNTSNNTIDARIPDFGSDTLTIGGTTFLPLPVTLLGIEADCGQGPYPTVRWKTASEINNSHFVVQKSYNGINRQDVGQLQGAGTSNQLNEYEFVDTEETSGQIIYYRFRQEDFDGSSEYSPIVAAHCKADDIMSMRAFPNPTSGLLTVEFMSSTPEDMPMVIYDAQGKVITSQMLQAINGTKQYYIDVSNLSAGLYYLRVGDESVKVIKK